MNDKSKTLFEYNFSSPRLAYFCGCYYATLSTAGPDIWNYHFYNNSKLLKELEQKKENVSNIYIKSGDKKISLDDLKLNFIKGDIERILKDKKHHLYVKKLDYIKNWLNSTINATGFDCDKDIVLYMFKLKYEQLVKENDNKLEGILIDYWKRNNKNFDFTFLDVINGKLFYFSLAIKLILKILDTDENEISDIDEFFEAKMFKLGIKIFKYKTFKYISKIKPLKKNEIVLSDIKFTSLLKNNILIISLEKALEIAQSIAIKNDGSNALTFEHLCFYDSVEVNEIAELVFYFSTIIQVKEVIKDESITNKIKVHFEDLFGTRHQGIISYKFYRNFIKKEKYNKYFIVFIKMYWGDLDTYILNITEIADLDITKYKDIIQKNDKTFNKKITLLSVKEFISLANSKSIFEKGKKYYTQNYGEIEVLDIIEENGNKKIKFKASRIGKRKESDLFVTTFEENIKLI